MNAASTTPKTLPAAKAPASPAPAAHEGVPAPGALNISGTSAAVVEIGFGAVAGVLTVCVILFAVKTAKARGPVRTVASLVAAFLALILLLAGGALLGHGGGKVLADVGVLIDALVAFVSQPYFWGAALAGALLCFLRSKRRHGESGSESEPLALAAAQD